MALSAQLSAPEDHSWQPSRSDQRSAISGPTRLHFRFDSWLL